MKDFIKRYRYFLTKQKQIIYLPEQMRNHSQTIDNPQQDKSYLERSTKAMQRPLVQKSTCYVHGFKLKESVKLRKSNENLKNVQLLKSSRTIEKYLKQQPLNESFGSNKNIIKNKKRVSVFEQTFQSIYNDGDNRTLALVPKWSQDKMNFNSTIKRFTQIQSYRASENNSPRKQTIPGAQDHYDTSKLMSITMRNFQTVDPLIKHKDKVQKEKRKYQLNQSVNLPQILKVKQQSASQKRKFYQMHPYFLTKQDSKSLQRRVDKRKNLIGLQDLYIRLRNKETRKKYDKK